MEGYIYTMEMITINICKPRIAKHARKEKDKEEKKKKNKEKLCLQGQDVCNNVPQELNKFKYGSTKPRKMNKFPRPNTTVKRTRPLQYYAIYLSFQLRVPFQCSNKKIKK